MTTFTYLQLLDHIHQTMQPRCYVEIGVRSGSSASLALPGTKSILIDPEPHIRHALPEHRHLITATSDEYFSSHVGSTDLSSGDIDLAYIDGMHLFEFALRDFFNVEKYARPDSVIILDDCMPPTPQSALRDRESTLWAGDVYKVIMALEALETPPSITMLDLKPAGQAIITNLKPERNLGDADISALVERYVGATLAEFQELLELQLQPAPPTRQLIDSLLPSPWRQEPVTRLLEGRANRSQPLSGRLVAPLGSILRVMPDPIRDRIRSVAGRVSAR